MSVGSLGSVPTPAEPNLTPGSGNDSQSRAARLIGGDQRPSTTSRHSAAERPEASQRARRFALSAPIATNPKAVSSDRTANGRDWGMGPRCSLPVLLHRISARASGADEA